MTSLVRWNPFQWPEVPSLLSRDIFNRDFFTWLQPNGEVAVEWSPRCDMTESANEILLQAELPGVARDDIKVTVEEGFISISGEKRTEKKEEKKGGEYTERFFGSFERRLKIPAYIDESKIEAKLSDGVLEVHLPKVPAPAKPEARKIPITAM